MRDSFWPGNRGSGPPGDPHLDALLPEAASEALLDEFLVGARGRGTLPAPPLPAELRQLGDTLVALGAPPSLSEFPGEAAVMAAFRAHSPAPGYPAGDARTLPLEIPRDLAGRRPPGARHRAPGGTRPGSRPPAGRPPARRRFGLTAVAAAALVMVIGIVTYSGNLPGPFQSAAHTVIGAPSSRTSPSASPNVPARSRNGVAGSATPAPPAPTTTTPAPTSGTTPGGPRQWCQAYFANPWRPGVTSWDEADFAKLEAAAHGAQWVLLYCIRYLDPGDGHGTPPGEAHRYPDGFDGGPWVPGGQGNGPAVGANVSGANGDGNSQPGPPAPPSPSSSSSQGGGGKAGSPFTSHG